MDVGIIEDHNALQALPSFDGSERWDMGSRDMRIHGCLMLCPSTEYEIDMKPGGEETRETRRVETGQGHGGRESH